MSDFNETQPTKITGDTAPNKITPETPPPAETPEETPRRRRRGKFWLGTLILIIILALGGFSGYLSGRADRVHTQSTVVSQQLGEQLQLAALDMAEGRYEQAKQRLEFIIEQDPGFPGVVEALTEVMLKLSITPTIPPTPTPSITPTPDMRGAQAIYERASQLMAAGNWSETIVALDELRKADPNYQTANVDGMYYMALRNQGVDQIVAQGNLEGGIYYFTLAGRFGPLDGYSQGLRDGARLYLTGASFWELDWEQVLYYFSQVYNTWPNLWDASSGLSGADRYRLANVALGDVYFNAQNYCQAEEYYRVALSIAPDGAVNERLAQANAICHPPTATPTATLEGIVTETPDPGPGGGNDG